MGCLECIKTYPQLYQIHEMTSLTGGTFDPGLTMTFEKQLLIMVMYFRRSCSSPRRVGLTFDVLKLFINAIVQFSIQPLNLKC